MKSDQWDPPIYVQAKISWFTSSLRFDTSTTGDIVSAAIWPGSLNPARELLEAKVIPGMLNPPPKELWNSIKLS